MPSKQIDTKRTSEPRSEQSKSDASRADTSGLSPFGRRRFLHVAGGLAITGFLAGCTDNGNGGNPTGESDSGSGNVEEYLSKTDNYDGVVDKTLTDTVTVEVGPDSNERVFAPAAIRISPGTTVSWEWIGSGYHNVVAEDDSFDSGDPEKKATFEHTFDATGTTLYYCQPHKSAEMKGAVIVADGEASGSPGNSSKQS